MTNFALFFKYIGISIRSQMQYKMSFILQSIGHFFTTFIEMICIILLFQRFGGLLEWTLREVAFLYGMINISFAIAESIGRGFDLFFEQIKMGLFDRILLRPRGAAFQIAASEMQLTKIGRFLQGLFILLWAALTGEIGWTFPKVMLLLFGISGGTALFYGLFVIQATLSFWSTETLELMNIATYGGTEASQYPIAIYKEWFQKFFTFIIPLACVNFFPMIAIFEKKCPLGSPVWFQWICPLFGFIFLFICLQIWKFGVKHYQSTGS
ncbi:MAG: ABC-2 family transporter protein [Spirochaetales bacterium]|nr:ABC-2 family transporter protein [Spirochaetales bacterium]